MLLSTSLCQENQTFRDICHPEKIYLHWKEKPFECKQLFQQILQSHAADVIKAQAVFWLFYLDRHGDLKIGRNSKQSVSFEKLRNKLAPWPQTWSEFYANYRLQGLRPEVVLALQLWIDHPSAAVLMSSVPPSERVLKMQCHGQRPVGICTDWHLRSFPIVDKPNAFDFMIHDLEHLYNFLHDPSMQKTQVGFFRWLAQLAQEIELPKHSHEKWQYLISDMNTHPLHSLAYLRAMNTAIDSDSRVNWQTLNLLNSMPPEAVNDFLFEAENAHRERPHLMSYWHALGALDLT